MRVKELLNTKPLGVENDSRTANTIHVTEISAHAIMAEAAEKPYQRPYQPDIIESKADTTTRKMRLKEFLLRYHVASLPNPVADPQGAP